MNESADQPQARQPSLLDALIPVIALVVTFAYLPYCFYNIINPILSVIYGFTGFKMERLPPEGPVVESSGLQPEPTG